MKITDKDTEPKGYDFPKPKPPDQLKPVEESPLPVVKLSFWEKTKRFFTDLFSFAQDTVKAVNNFHSSIKWVVIALVLIIVLVIVL